MNKKIFRNLLVSSSIVLVSTVVLILGVLFSFFENQLKEELKDETEYISAAYESKGEDFLKNFDSKEKRITLIDPKGNVLYDTSVDPAKLDNHANREEVKQAMDTGNGTSVRYSKTLTQKTIYYAIKLDNGNILRVSTLQYTAFAVILGLLQPIVIIIIIMLILCLVLSSRAAKSIIKPINELDIDNPEKNTGKVYDEIAPLLSKIAALKRTINKQLVDAKQKQEEFRLITENMSEGFLVIDKSANLLTYNTAALKLLEIDSVRNESVLTLNRTRNFREVVEKALSGSRAENNMTLYEHYYNLIANPVFENQDVIGAIIIIVDITESYKREALRREFTANVSHELKTPLTSISGFAELMKDGDTSEETVKDFSKSIYDEAQRLITLVNDIIKITQLDETTEKYDVQSVDLYSLAESVVSSLKLQIEKKHIKISVSGKHCSVMGTPQILDEMIYNLCDNAIKYNKENGSVDIIISENDKNVSISVSDTGIGIPIADQNRVFERFYRVDKSHSKAIGGTGLGLSIVKHGALYHNASIDMESHENQGTKITITFNK